MDLQLFQGFARGVDSLAHKMALDLNGSAVEVLDNGLDIFYPT